MHIHSGSLSVWLVLNKEDMFRLSECHYVTSMILGKAAVYQVSLNNKGTVLASFFRCIVNDYAQPFPTLIVLYLNGN